MINYHNYYLKGFNHAFKVVKINNESSVEFYYQNNDLKTKLQPRVVCKKNLLDIIKDYNYNCNLDRYILPEVLPFRKIMSNVKEVTIKKTRSVHHVPTQTGTNQL